MDRLTVRADGVRWELREGCTPEDAVARLAAYENAHAALLAQRDRAEEKLSALRGLGKGRSVSFQQALAEKLTLTALLDQLERPLK